MIEGININCPYCGEIFETTADCSAGDQEYIEDCHVCCQPIVLTIVTNDYMLVRVDVRRDNE